MLARDKAGVNIYRLLIFMKKRQAPHELDVLVGNDDFNLVKFIGKDRAVGLERRGTSILRNQPLRVSIIKAVQEHLFVVSPNHHDVRVFSRKPHHPLDHTRRVLAAVYQVPEKNDLVFVYVPGNIPLELIEQSGSAVYIPNDVSRHFKNRRSTWTAVSSRPDRPRSRTPAQM